MRTSEKGIALIKLYEGFRAQPYQCQAKVWTIGYGHTKDVTSSTPSITKQEADELFTLDIRKYETSVVRLVGVVLEQHEFDALASFIYNCGGAKFQRSLMRQKLNRGDRAGAANQFLRWTRAGGVVSRGLLKRRKAEREMFLGLA